MTTPTPPNRFMAPGPWITRELRWCVEASDYDALQRELAAAQEELERARTSFTFYQRDHQMHKVRMAQVVEAQERAEKAEAERDEAQRLLKIDGVQYDACLAERDKLRAERDALRDSINEAEVLTLNAVKQRLLNWRQRTMNKSGDRLALDDFMGDESIKDLIDYVCDEFAPIDAAMKEPK